MRLWEPTFSITKNIHFLPRKQIREGHGDPPFATTGMSHLFDVYWVKGVTYAATTIIISRRDNYIFERGFRKDKK